MSNLITFGANSNSSPSALSPEMKIFLVNWRVGIRIILKYVIIPLVVFNCIGNIISFLIFIKPSFRKVSVGFYFSALSIANILGSTVSIYNYLNLIVYNSSFYKTNYYTLMLFLQTTTPYYTSWLSVCVILDRCLSVVSVKLIKILDSRKLQIFVVAFLVTILTAFNIPILINQEFDLVTQHSAFYNNVYPFFDLIITTLLPFSLMCILNFATVMLLRKSKVKFKKKGNETSKEEKKQNKFLVTSIALNVLFFIFFVPQSLIQIWVKALFDQTNGENQIYSFIMNLNLVNVFSVSRTTYFFVQPFFYYGVNPIYRKELNESVKMIFKNIKICKK